MQVNEASTHRLPVVSTGSVKSRVTSVLRDAICAGRLKPGEPLRELHLAKELRVSQATVRSALVDLEHSGLVVRVPNRETIVTRFTAREVRERSEIRAVLEGLAAVGAATRLTSEHYAELDRLVAAIQSHIEVGDPIALAQADMALHQYLWRCSGNETLWRTLEQLTAPLFVFVGLVRSSRQEDFRSGVANHQPLIDALKRNVPDEIRAAFREHILGTVLPGLKDEPGVEAARVPVTAALG